MEPPLRVRMLQVAQLRDPKDWPPLTRRGNANLVLPLSRRDSPLDLVPGNCYGNHSQRSKSKARAEKHRQHFLQLMLASSISIRDIHSPGASRDSLFGGFVNDLTWMQSTPSRFTVLRQLRTYFDSGQDDGPMATATDTLLLAQFALTVGDTQYIAAAQHRYGLAMSRCARKLASNPSKLEDWIESLAAIQALWTCEMYDDLSQGRKVWVQHNEGMLAILNSIRLQNLANGYFKTVIYNAIDTTLKTAICTRKPPIFAEQHWMDLISSSCDGRGLCLQHVVCQLPTLLCRIDELGEESTGSQDFVHLLNGLLTIERDLLRWLEEWYRSNEHIPIRTRSVHNFPDFVRRHEQNIHIFPQAFDFPSPVEAIGHLIFYDWLGLVREAICDLHNRPQCFDFVSESDRQRALSNATDCADAACMLAPYSSQMEQTEAAKPLTQALSHAEEWYQTTGQVEKLGYVRDIFGDEAKHAEDHKLLRWQNVNGFLARRTLLQHCIGPPKCVLKDEWAIGPVGPIEVDE